MNANSAGETIGAAYLGGHACQFRVWAPAKVPVGVRLLRTDRLIPLEKTGRGYHEAVAQDVAPGDLYLFDLAEAGEHPDPASRFQPQGVHGPSQVVDARELVVQKASQAAHMAVMESHYFRLTAGRREPARGIAV